MMLALALTPLTSMAASPLAFNFSCASIGGVNSDGKGNVWIDGGKATVKAFNENYWEATSVKIPFLSPAKMTEIRTYPGLDLIVSTGFACRRTILITLQRKNRPTLVRLTPALLFKREVRKILFARVHRSLQWI